jgi:hypothetical protein
MEGILRAVGEWAVVLLICFLYPYILMRITPLEDEESFRRRMDREFRRPVRRA